MRSGGMTAAILLMTAFCGLSQAYAQERLVMNDIAPFVSEDISIEPQLLTVKDIEAKLKSSSQDNPEEDQKSLLDLEQSPLEKMYSNRVLDPVSQFGYDMFSNSAARERNKDIPAGAVLDSFILNVGDELSVLIRGQRQDTQTAKITSEGMLVIDDLPPIPAAGRSLGEVREQLRSEVSQLYNTDVFLSLTHVNQVNVLVVGHVKNPGRQVLTNFDSILDALISAGGIEKTGTLRQIRLIRDGKTMLIDLYGLLIYGNGDIDMGLRNNDKIVVRPIGPTLAVAGDAKRPGIYEILPALKSAQDRSGDKSQKLSMIDLLDISGDVLSPAAHRFLRMDITDTGEENIQEVEDRSARIFSNGDMLNIVRGKEKREGTVQLVGNANQSGLHSLSESETLAALLYDDSVIGPDTYPLIGVIEHWNKTQMSKELHAFAPKLVLSGKYDRKLYDGDSVYLFSQNQIDALKKTDPQAELIEAAIGNKSKKKSDYTLSNSMRKFLIERSLFIRGSVREPGSYPVAEGTTLDAVLAVAGGTSLEGNQQNIEVTSGQKRETYDLSKTDPHNIRLASGDTVRVNQKFRRIEDTHVLLIGEVKNPGTFDLQPGDTLGKLLSRAGGITEDAYPDGAIFSRQSERKREETRFKAQAQDLELKLASMLEEKDKEKPNAENIQIAKDVISQLKQAEALGRLTVEADPVMLKSQPQLDILLETGDRIYIPKRPLTVRVAGEVLSPAALQFRTEKKPRDYINEAGGTSFDADRDRAFVIYPDGSAKPLAVSAWNHSADFIPPGSTIVVPRDPKPLTFLDGAKDVSQILANVATAAIFADDIRDDR